MNCKELVELVTDYLENTLPPDEHSRFEQHLASCEGCQRYLFQMRQTIHVVGQLSETDLSTQAQDELLALFRHWKTRS